MAAISEFSAPKDKHEGRRFLGMAGFFRRFVPGFAEMARPLSNLLKKAEEFVWGQVQEEAFSGLKAKLGAKQVLRIYNPGAVRTELHTDASKLGLGAMLFQADTEEEKVKLVYAISRTTSEAESKYHSRRLEMLAVAWALQKLRPFSIGLKFVVYTDRQSMIHMNAWKTKNAQIARWMS